MPEPTITRLTITWSKNTEVALRSHLGSQGLKMRQGKPLAMVMGVQDQTGAGGWRRSIYRFVTVAAQNDVFNACKQSERNFGWRSEYNHLRLDFPCKAGLAVTFRACG